MSGEKLWFRNSLVCVRVAYAAGTDGISVLEHWVPGGDSVPLHLHRTEDEAFCLLEGEARFVVGGKELRAAPGAWLLAPKGVPHTYRVESRGGGRFLTVTTRGDFERFVRTLARPAERDGLPPPQGPPTPEQIAALAAAAAPFGIELVGPPLG
jgi:mannose-6-phosphate isomerase-like protein (cupin superfamily)